MAIRTAFTVMACVAAACGGSPELTDSPEPTARVGPEPMLRAEISRIEVEAEAETVRLPSYDIQRREFVENAWRFDEDAVEIECWVVSAERPEYYTVRLPSGQRIGPQRAFSDGMFRVPALGPFGYELPDEFTVELPDVAQDDRLSGVADIVARQVCGGSR